MFPSLTVALTLAALTVAQLASAEMRTDVLSSFDLEPPNEKFGGLSGLDVHEDGQMFTTVSDTGMLYRGAFIRDELGNITGVTLLQTTALLMENGKHPKKKRHRDTEGLALSSDNRIHISTEHKSRLLSYDANLGIPQSQDLPYLVETTPENMGFEALALSPNGTFVVLREGSRNIRAPFEVFAKPRSGDWGVIYNLPRHGGYRPVGADFGPDGHLYILQRSFIGFAFGSRIVRILFKGDTPIGHETVVSLGFGKYDNLEGLAAWRDADGNIRLIAVSDDNFKKAQSTKFVEFRIKE